MARRDLPCFAVRTFRPDGRAVVTPVWLAPDGAGWVGFTPARSGKARRLGRDPRVEFAPSTFDGRPREPWRPATAAILDRAGTRRARRLLRARYGRAFAVFELVTLLGRPRWRGGAGVGFRVVPA